MAKLTQILDSIKGTVVSIGGKFGVNNKSDTPGTKNVSEVNNTTNSNDAMIDNQGKLLIRDNNYHFRVVFARADGSHEISSRGGVTVAYRKQPDGSYRMACSVCSLSDNYSMRIGRQCASSYTQMDEHKPLVFSGPLTAANASAVAHAIAFAAATSMVLRRVSCGYITAEEGTRFLENLRLRTRSRSKVLHRNA